MTYCNEPETVHRFFKRVVVQDYWGFNSQFVGITVLVKILNMSSENNQCAKYRLCCSIMVCIETEECSSFSGTVWLD